MPRSTKKSITVPNPVREGLIEQVKGGILEYPSENAARIGLARYQLLIGKPHPVTGAVARMHPDDQRVIGDFLLDHSQRALSLKGQFLSRLIQQAIDGCTEPTEQEVAGLVPGELRRMAREWHRAPASAFSDLARPE